MVKVSVIVPAYNEEDSIIQLLEKVSKVKIEKVDLEVIVIDDCSKDSTLKLLHERPDLYTLLLAQPKNRGKGSAVKAGIESSTGEFILFQDADLEYDPADYTKLLEPVLRLKADIVMGSRLVASPITRVSYFWHRVGNKMITFLFNILNNTTFTDIYSCYLVYRKDLFPIQSIITEGWEQHAEILSEAIAKGKKVYEVPISYYGRTYDEGKKIRAYHLFPVVSTILTKRLFR